MSAPQIVFRSGLVASARYVRDFLAANGLGTEVKVGWKERAKQDNQGAGRANRVIFIPSDLSGRGGSIVGPHQGGERDVRQAVDAPRHATVREISGWRRVVTLSIWAYDGDDRENEEAQIEAVETLHEWVTRAVHSAPGAFATPLWGDVSWPPRGERQFGVEMLVGLTFRQPLFDQPRPVVYPTTGTLNRG